MEKETEIWTVFCPDYFNTPDNVMNEIRDIWADQELHNGSALSLSRIEHVEIQIVDGEWREVPMSEKYPALAEYLKEHNFTHIYYWW